MPGTVGLLRRHSLLLTALVVPSALCFAEHLLHARVQGDWPSFLYPAFAVAAAGAARRIGGAGWTEWLIRFSKQWAAPVALLFLAIADGQALTGILPMRDPTARLHSTGFQPVADDIAALRTTSYTLTGWLAFYPPDHSPVV